MGVMCGFRVRIGKILSNKLLNRTQFTIQVLHQGSPNVSKKELERRIADIYKPDDKHQIVVSNLRTFFGGKSTGLGLVYDNLDAVRRFEPRYRQVRLGLLKKSSQSRKQIKERKNRHKTKRGS